MSFFRFKVRKLVAVIEAWSRTAVHVKKQLTKATSLSPKMHEDAARVLVVEDEFIIRMGATVVLTEAGFHVVEAERADEALAVLQARADEIHAVFTDVHVPGKLNGMELAHMAQRLWPWIAILLASGRSRPGKHELPHGSRFIPKPYDPNHVVGHLQEMISR